MKSFAKTYVIKATPAAVFAALTDPVQVAAWSGGPATMSAAEGETFSLWGGSIQGVNREVSPLSLVQDWKEAGWDDYSQVTFQLEAAPGSTSVLLSHDGIPDQSLKSIKGGWDKYYMVPLTRHVEATTSDNPYFQPFMGKPGVTRSKMFGWDCLKVNGNVFVTQTPDRLAVAGSDYFAPTPGMPKMKEWIALPLVLSPEVMALARATHDLIATLPVKPAKGKQTAPLV